MSNTLIVTASARGAGTSRNLADVVAEVGARRGDAVDRSDLSRTPPPPLDALFIRAAFTRDAQRTPAMRRALAYSDAEIAKLESADTLVIATPMYNFGVPGLLKSWFDQIIRPAKTFVSTGDPARPYRGLLAIARCIVITVRGSAAFAPHGPASDLNFLDPHLRAMLALVGVDSPEFVDVSGTDDEPAAARRQQAGCAVRLARLHDS